MDGFDETVLPCDYATAGQITDDEMFSIMIQPLPPGARFTAVMDCCHSGTGLDLPFSFALTSGILAQDPSSFTMTKLSKKELKQLKKQQKNASRAVGDKKDKKAGKKDK